MPSVLQTIQKGDSKTLERLLGLGESPTGSDETTGESFLTITAFRGDLEMVQLLLAAGADPNFLGTTAWPLDSAAGQGHAAIVEALLFSDADVDSLDEDSGTALMSATAAGHLEIVEMLLEAGADPRRKDRYGKRPIVYAAEKGHRELVNVLATVSTANDKRQAEFLLKLAEQGPPTEAALAFHEAADKGDLESVKKYLNAGGDVDAMTEGGETAFMAAALRGHVDILKELATHGANVNHLDGTGTYSLIYAGQDSQNPAYDYVYSLTSDKLRKDWAKREKMALKIAKERGYIQ